VNYGIYFCTEDVRKDDKLPPFRGLEEVRSKLSYQQTQRHSQTKGCYLNACFQKRQRGWRSQKWWMPWSL